MEGVKDSFDYQLVVIGAGTAGLVSSFVAAGLGAKVLLVERDRMGGECLWTGCVPSKTLIKSARVWDTVQRAAEFGVHVEKPRVVWNAVRLRIADVRDEIKALEREQMQQSGVEFVSGTARFLDSQTIEIHGKDGTRTVRGEKFILATGSKVKWPEVPGIEESGCITHEQVFDLPSMPRTLAILGGGPISCEIAQAFARFGSRVTLLQKGAHLLPREDAEISEAALKLLRQSGVTVHLEATANTVQREDDGIHLDFTSEGGAQTVRASNLLVATGKRPEFAGLNLESAGVKTSEDGVVVDDHLRTSAPNIWACGDLVGRYLFTHVAEYEAKIAAQNALLPVKAKVDYSAVPWTTFTDPEIARVGLTETEANEKFGQCKVFRAEFKDLDRAIIEGEAQGFLKIVTGESGRILGAHIIGPSAGELIHPFITAVREGGLVQEFAEAMHVYPTLSEIGHRAGNGFYQELLEAKSTRWLLKKIIH